MHWFFRWSDSIAAFRQDGVLASCDRNFLAGQGIVHSNRKIASQLSPVLMAIRPSSKLKGYRTGAEVDYVDLRQWFFCYTRMSSGSTFQQFNHALRIGASNHVDGDFDHALAIRKGPVKGALPARCSLLSPCLSRAAARTAIGFPGEAEACWLGAAPPLETKARIINKAIRIAGCMERQKRGSERAPPYGWSH